MKLQSVHRWMIIALLLGQGVILAKKPPERPQWLKEKLKKFRLSEKDISYFGDKSLYGSGRLRSWDNVGEKVKIGKPEEMAKEFLRKHAKEFGFKADLSELRLKRVKQTSENIYRVEFNQMYNNVPVYGGEVVVVLKDDGEILSVYSGYRKGISLKDLTPIITEASAIQIVKDFLQISGKIYLGPVAKLKIFPFKGNRLVYVVKIYTDNPEGGWEAFVDAKTGEIIHLVDRNKYAYGSGYVYNPDPLTTAHVNYDTTTPYADHNDSTNYYLDAERVNVTLLDIYWDSNNNLYYLKGPYVKITDLAAYPDPVYSSTDGTFYYNRQEQGFEAVMAYYHIDNYQRYIQSLGFLYHTDTIDVDPHGRYGDNSKYVDSLDAILFGEGGVDDAEDADVIIHEYGHALEQSAMGGFNYDWSEAGALSEGYSDYFAGSYSAQIDTYRMNWVFNWDGHNEFWNGRVLNTTKHYPEDMTGDWHKDGEIWSACLWEIFKQYGGYITDKISLGSLQFLWSFANFKDAAKKVLYSDYFYFNGTHMNFIRQVFYNRGILTPPIVTVNFPNGGETFVQGSVERIKWSFSDYDALTDHINLYYYYNGTWNKITVVFPPVNYYDWTVPNITSNNVKIKVELADEADNPIVWDVSDNYFKIVPKPGLTITYPNGGEILLVGSTDTIKWNYSDPNNTISYLKLYYSTDNGQNYTPISGNVQNTGFYPWQVPNTPTNQARIKIEAYNVRDVLIQEDVSNNSFIITIPPSVTLI